MRVTGPARARHLFLIIAVGAAVLAVITGLSRIGWRLGGVDSATGHGPLLVLGFLGTVIGMERAVALDRVWTWWVPALSATSVPLTVAGLDESAALLLVASGLALIAVFITAHRIQPEAHIVVMGAGAVSWALAAGGMAAGVPVTYVVPALGGFVMLTIIGERLEMTRVTRPPRMVVGLILAASGLLLAGGLTSLWDVAIGSRIAAVGMLGATLTLFRHDVARRTIQVPGVTRYMASALLAGYTWLAVAGAAWLLSGLSRQTLLYDVAVHALFLGFVISMVFAHAPVIVPSLTKLAFPFNPLFWAPLALLHVSLLLRVVSDLAGWQDGRAWGGMLNAIAMLVFALLTVGTILSARRTALTPGGS